MNEIELGRVVVSRAGRDKGRPMIVVALSSPGYASVADGALRKLAAPKKKKLMHVTPRPELISSIRDKLMGGGHLLDSDLRGALASLQDKGGLCK